MLIKKGTWVGAMLLGLAVSVTHADGIKDLALTHLDGKGTVDSIDASNDKIVINDKLYFLAEHVSVFDAAHRRNSSVEDIKPGNSVGFTSKPLSNPTAPYDQMIVRLWIMPTSNQ